jgi:hypothetical protein
MQLRVAFIGSQSHRFLSVLAGDQNPEQASYHTKQLSQLVAGNVVRMLASSYAIPQPLSSNLDAVVYVLTEEEVERFNSDANDPATVALRNILQTEQKPNDIPRFTVVTINKYERIEVASLNVSSAHKFVVNVDQCHLMSAFNYMDRSSYSRAKPQANLHSDFYHWMLHCLACHPRKLGVELRSLQDAAHQFMPNISSNTATMNFLAELKKITEKDIITYDTEEGIKLWLKQEVPSQVLKCMVEAFTTSEYGQKLLDRIFSPLQKTIDRIIEDDEQSKAKRKSLVDLRQQLLNEVQCNLAFVARHWYQTYKQRTNRVLSTPLDWAILNHELPQAARTPSQCDRLADDSSIIQQAMAYYLQFRGHNRINGLQYFHNGSSANGYDIHRDEIYLPGHNLKGFAASLHSRLNVWAQSADVTQTRDRAGMVAWLMLGLLCVAATLPLSLPALAFSSSVRQMWQRSFWNTRTTNELQNIAAAIPLEMESGVPEMVR